MIGVHFLEDADLTKHNGWSGIIVKETALEYIGNRGSIHALRGECSSHGIEIGNRWNPAIGEIGPIVRPWPIAIDALQMDRGSVDQSVIGDCRCHVCHRN